jgi:hypothetical protein
VREVRNREASRHDSHKRVAERLFALSLFPFPFRYPCPYPSVWAEASAVSLQALLPSKN